MRMLTVKFKSFHCSQSQIIIHVLWVQTVQYLLCTNHIFLGNYNLMYKLFYPLLLCTFP